MTGLERLRNVIEDIIGTSIFYDSAITLSDIEDQIEREQSEDHEIAEWVRARGGIEEVRSVMREADNRRVELCSWLGIDTDTGWSDAAVEMGRRLMPTGYEWPRFDDGEKVLFGDEYAADRLGLTGEVYSIKVDEDGEFELNETQFCKDERVKRPKQDTNAKPEPPDSWERLEKDSKENPFDYCKKVGHYLFTFENAEEFKSVDIVRRAKALAEQDKE